MGSRRLNLRPRMVLRAPVYAMVICSLLLVGVPSREVRGSRLMSGKTISFGPSHSVGATAAEVYSVASGDLDNDGDLDIVSGALREEDYELIAWENDGTPFTGLWNQHDVGASTDGVGSVALGDLDGDGDLDIVSGSGGRLIAWENDGTPFTGLWNQHDVAATTAHVYSVALGDLDGDGDLDIVSGTSWEEDYEVITWENDGTPFTGLWNRNHVGRAVWVYSVALGDLDGDGDLDIVWGNSIHLDYEVIASENDSSPFTDLWNQNGVGASFDVFSVAVGDLDGDGDLDIVSGSWSSERAEVIAWENDGSPFTDLWNQNDVGESGHINSVALGDLDDDGDLDIVSGGEGYPPDYAVIAWENDGSPFAGLWKHNGVGDRSYHYRVRSVALGDLDDDGDLDIVSSMSYWKGPEVIAWENTSFFGVYLPLVARNYPCPDFFDDFGNPASGWEVGENDYYRSEYLNGEYRVLTKQAGYLYGFDAPTCDRQNYVVEADARWVDTPSGSYGILFGITDGHSQYYLFDVNTDFQQFRLYRRDSSGLIPIVPPTTSSAINGGTASNHIKATRNGSSITLEVSGTVLGTWSDSAISGLTGVGLVSSPYSDSPVSDARFDNFSVTSLPGNGPLVQGPGRTATESCESCKPSTRLEPVPTDIGW